MDVGAGVGLAGLAAARLGAMQRGLLLQFPDSPPVYSACKRVNELGAGVGLAGLAMSVSTTTAAQSE